jgi:folate-binding protein YgfZ
MSSSEIPAASLPVPAVSFDISDWTQLELSGAQSRSFLHNFCTNDIQGLDAGQSCEAFACDIKGRILAHFTAIALPQSLRLVGVPGTAAILVPHLQKYLLGADVEIRDRTSELGLLCACGADLPAILTAALGLELDGQLRTCQTVAASEGELAIVGTDLLPAPAVLISGPRSDVAALRERIPHEVMALGNLNLFHLLRIEAGFPWFGVDIGSQNIAQEAARTKQAISFTKGCYLGQEPIARLDAMGHTNRELRGLEIDAENVQPGDAVLADGAEIGTLSSVSWSPLREASVGLGMLRSSPLEKGAALQVHSGNTVAAARVFWPPPNA